MKWNDVQVNPVFNNCGVIFELAESDSINEGKRFLKNATIYIQQKNKNRYLKIQSPMIRHDNEESQVLSSDKGRLQIYNITMNE